MALQNAKNRTLMDAVRRMLIDAEMEKKYWAEAVNTACYLQNILPSKAVTKGVKDTLIYRKINDESYMIKQHCSHSWDVQQSQRATEC